MSWITNGALFKARASIVSRGLIRGTALLCGATAVMSSVQAATPYRNWGTPIGGSPDSSNYTALSQIKPSNVSKLSPAWTYPTGDTLIWKFSPIVIGRTIYGFSHSQDLVAVDAVTGSEIWRHRAPPRSTNMRGFNYWQSKDGKDKRLFLTGAVSLYAVNAENGEIIQSFGTGGKVALNEGLDRDPAIVTQVASKGSGRIFENLLILGSSPGEAYQTPPGDIRAFDVVTGKLVWTFHTIPRPGEFGYDTNPPNGYKWIGAANNWGDMSLDKKRGIVYIPTGSPTYDFWGGDRPGDNLFGNSLLALDARTGKRIWHFQTIHHDLLDYDLVSAPQLVTIRQNGKKIDAVAQAGKVGFLYVFDRVTGKPIWPIVEKPVPASTTPGEHASPTQPIPLKPPPFARQSFTEKDINPYIMTDVEREQMRELIRSSRNDGLFTPPGLHQFSVNMPGHSGGSAMGGTSSDPAKGMVYIVSFDGPAFLRLEETQAATANNSLVGPGVPEWPGCGDAICRPSVQFNAQAIDAVEGGGAPRPAANPEQVAAGKILYTQNCQGCHGADLEGGNGPPLSGAVARLGAPAISAAVQNGQGQMPRFASLSNADVSNIVAFVGQSPAGGGRGRSGAAPRPPEYPADAKRLYTGYGMAPAAIDPPWSTLTAYDLNKGEIKWQIPYGNAVGIDNPDNNFGVLQIHSPKAPVIVTSTGLLLSATPDKKLRAFDAKTGKTLWSADLPDRAMGNPAVYQLNGKEYLLVITRGAYVAYALSGKG